MRCSLGKYATGQNVLVFLKSEENRQLWKILSDGDEGELPVDEGKVNLSSWYAVDMPFKAVIRTDINGKSET